MNYRNIDTLSLLFSNWISPLFFFQVEFTPPPGGGRGRFWPKYLPLGKLHKFVVFAMENVRAIEDKYRHCYSAKYKKIRQVYNVAYNVWSCHLYLVRHWPSFRFVWWVELKTALYHTRLSVFVVTILLWRFWKNYYSNYYYSFFSEMFWGWIHPSDAINIESFDNHSHALYLTLKVA